MSDSDPRIGGRDTASLARRGFTLVEVLVAVAITGLLSIAIYSLFSTTSSALFEADSLAQTVDNARFAMERLRSRIQNAGALATPDSQEDPWVQPKASNGSAAPVRVAGLVTYGGWQDYATSGSDPVMSSEIMNANTGGPSGNLSPNFDGIIVIGAYDFPMTFEIGSLSDSSNTGRVYETQRGLYKLARRDPFNTDIADKSGSGTFDFSKSDPYAPMKRHSEHRILRVMDRSGYMQFTGMTAPSSGKPAAIEAHDGAVTKNYLEINFEDSLYFREEGAENERVGLDPESQEDDIAYDAAMLDVFWYHVINPDSAHEANFKLVRERLNGAALMDDLESTDWGAINPADYLALAEKDNRRYVVIAENVADFQIWFDCETNNGNVQGVSWNAEWDPPDASSVPHDCAQPGLDRISEARIAHVRLSVRTENERRDLRHRPFPQSQTSGNDNRTMQTFDINPSMEGATRVHTVQSDFELPNFAIRNVN